MAVYGEGTVERPRRDDDPQNFTQQDERPPPPPPDAPFTTGTHAVGTASFQGGVSDIVGRYRQMAASKGLRQGPQIDQGLANESRDAQSSGIDMLQARAFGAPTPAQYLMGRQTQGAVQGLQSNAASIRGGAMARAAAQRGAQSLGSRIQAQGNQDRSALRAREMADATGQYFGAATDQRTADLGVATDQAKLQVGQNALNAQAQNAYEQLGYDTKNAALGQQLGRSAADQAAANTARQQGQAENAAAWQQTKDVGSAVIGGTTGGIQAYNKSQQGPQPYDPNKTTSDVRSKEDVRPVGNSTRDRVRAKAAELSGTSYEDGYDNSMFQRNDGSDPQALHAGIEARIAEDGPRGGIVREDPYAAPKPMNFGTGNVLSAAAPGYAGSRAGQAGYMFGGAPEATHGFEKRDAMTSDPRAKAEAWDQGHAAAIANVEKVARWSPEEIKKYSEGDEYLPAAATVRGIKMAAWDEGRGSKRDEPAPAPQPKTREPESFVRGPDASPEPPVTAKGPQASPATRSALPAPRPSPGARPAAAKLGALLGRGYDAAHPAGPFMPSPLVPSDERTKNVGQESPMAAANRSMAASSYRYKDEFTPPEQDPGEENVGPMADKMKANRIARTAIIEDPKPPHMLAIDKTKGLKLVMGGLADVQRQIDQMKKGRA